MIIVRFGKIWDRIGKKTCSMLHFLFEYLLFIWIVKYQDKANNSPRYRCAAINN